MAEQLYKISLPERSPVRCFVAASPGLEPDVAAELHALGWPVESTEGGVMTALPLADIPRLVRILRCASRVYVRLATAVVADEAGLRRLIDGLPWSLWRAPESIEARVAARKVSSARAGWLAHAVDRILNDKPRGLDPPLTLLVRMTGAEVEISVDAAGRPMHQRGWRTEQGEAPLRETVAAALVRAVGYDGSQVLWDPMCGSGTLAIEAATWRVPAAWRAWAVDAWDLQPHRDPEPQPPTPALILAGDLDAEVLEVAQRNAERAGVADRIQFRHAEIASQLPAGVHPQCVVANPPWGKRLGGRNEARRLIQRLAAVLARDAAGARAAILVPEPQMARELPLSGMQSRPVDCGGITLHLVTGTIQSTRSRR